MPLHPQAQAVADFYAAVRTTPFEELSPTEARALYSAGQVPSTEVVHEIRDVQAGSIPCRLYRPSVKTDLGLLVFFHGGGWVIGDLNSHDGVCRSLANKSGHAVLSVDYRLAPEHKFPIPFDDCWASVEWVIENAKSLNINPKKIAVSGDSAGGNLASAVALKARDKNIELAYQLLLYPCNQKDRDTESMNDYAEGYGFTRYRMTYLWDQYLNGNSDDNNPYAVPQSAPTLKGLAPAIVILAQCDVLYSDGKKYAQRLTDEEVSVSLREYPGMLHGFFSLGAFLTDSLRLREEISEEINKILGS